MTRRPSHIPHNNLQVIQWNARGLTKAKLEEFKQFLSSVCPDIVLLCETHWKPYFNVMFKSYHVIKKDRPNRAGGGVAILIKKNINFSPFSLTLPDTIEAIGVSIKTSTNSQIDIISIYVPKGDCEVADIELLFNRPNPILVGGDFNGHHSMWESDTQTNKAGRSISEALLNSNSICLLTPHNLGTRIDPSTGKPTTIDLTIASSSLATSPSITTSQHMGSDHLPLTILLNASPARNTGQPATWITNDKKWNDWNALIDETLQDANFHSLTNPTEVSSTFYQSIETANLKFFKLSQPPSHKCEAQCRPWWNDECKAVVCTARKAFRKWRNSPLSSTLISEWSRAGSRS